MPNLLHRLILVFPALLAPAPSLGNPTVEPMTRAETVLTIDGKRRTITVAELRAMREALRTYLADHPPATRLSLPVDWRERVPTPHGEVFIDVDGVARVPPWLLEASPPFAGPVLTWRVMGAGGGGFEVLATLRRHGADWVVDGLVWGVLRPPRRP